MCACANLQRQERSTGVDQVHARQTIFDCYFLRSEILLYRDRIRCASFHRSVAGNKHTPQTVDPADA